MLTKFLALLLSAVLTFPSGSGARPCWLSFDERDEVYARVDTSEKIIALTFDDGPHPYLTEQILDILDQFNVKATFFVVGKMCESYPFALKSIALRGHEIGNHTFTHLTETPSNADILRSEILKTEEKIFELTAKKTFLFRPPTGYCCAEAVKMTKELGYKTIVWDIDTRDWTSCSAESIFREIKKNARNGSIILFHDFIGRSSPTPKALRLVLPWLISQGYTFVTVGQLLSLK